GAPRSLPVPEVLREVERVAAAGFKEIALTGVHLGSYGRDLEPRTSLFALLSRLETWSAPTFAEGFGGSAVARRASGGGSLSGERHERPERGERSDVLFRISSLEPMDCSCDIVDLVSASARS